MASRNDLRLRWRTKTTERDNETCTSTSRNVGTRCRSSGPGAARWLYSHAVMQLCHQHHQSSHRVLPSQTSPELFHALPLVKLPPLSSSTSLRKPSPLLFSWSPFCFCPSHPFTLPATLAQSTLNLANSSAISPSFCTRFGCTLLSGLLVWSQQLLQLLVAL